MGVRRHYVTVASIPGGFEFVCRTCGYRARYTIDKNGVKRLDIRFAGDSQARHTSAADDVDVRDWLEPYKQYFGDRL